MTDQYTSSSWFVWRVGELSDPHFPDCQMLRPGDPCTCGYEEAKKTKEAKEQQRNTSGELQSGRHLCRHKGAAMSDKQRKPFNLERALAGDPVETRTGLPTAVDAGIGEGSCELCPSPEEHAARRPHELANCLHCGKRIWRVCDANPSKWMHVAGFQECAERPRTYAYPAPEHIDSGVSGYPDVECHLTDDTLQAYADGKFSEDMKWRGQELAKELLEARQALRMSSPSPAPQSTGEREAFEAWTRSAGMDTYVNVFGKYASTATQGAWEGWQARAALSRPSGETEGLLTLARPYKGEEDCTCGHHRSYHHNRVEACLLCDCTKYTLGGHPSGGGMDSGDEKVNPPLTVIQCKNSGLELFECPKCKSDSVYVTCLDPGDGLDPYWVECYDCGIRTQEYDEPELASAVWNQRQPIPAIRANPER